jgi:uncharacterized protein (TIGR03086 family)
MSIENLETAIASTRGVLSGVSAAQLDDDTPCAAWKVRDLINHVVGGQFFFARSVTGDAPAGEAPDFASGDFLAAFDEGSAKCAAAFAGPGVMESSYDLPFGTLTGAQFMDIATSDTFTHGWDLAHATGQGTDLEPALAATLLAHAHTALPDELRNEEGEPFGPKQEVPAGASNADQLAAFLGRTV